MKRILFAAAAALLMCLSLNAAQSPHLQIVPQPNSISLEKGSCKVAGININCDGSLDARTRKMIGIFADRLSLVTAKTSSVATPVGLSSSLEKASIKGMSFVPDKSLAPESYKLSIGKKSIVVKASDYNGFLYAVQTLKQMLPIEIYGGAPNPGADWSVPCCTIEDAPRFAYRGLHLDSGRHFWSVEEVKKYLDIMAIYKVNRFHWHLTEDQGWRIEIKKYPLLTEVGAYRNGTMIGKDYSSNDGIRYGGYYTQEQIRDIVKYADALGITIIPEVDLPGHMQAALASYPNLGCKDSKPQPYEVRTTWGISKQVLNVGKEETMRFLEDVLDEVADLFPGEYIHIGGDECPRNEWKTDPDCQAKIRELGLKSDDKASAEARLQNYVTARMQAFLATKGKKIIGWDEVLEGELTEGATVMSWRGVKGGIKAASMGYDVIMSPNTYCYIDHCQSRDIASEPLCITKPEKPERAVLMENMYKWEPLDGIDAQYHKHILGPQCNLWTEFIGTNEYLEYMLLPRMVAMSEVQWCNTGVRDYERFKASLQQHEFKIFDLLGYNYRKKVE